MLMKQACDTPLPRLFKSVGGKDVSDRGAFFCRDTLVLTAEVPRALGAACVVLRIARDGQAPTDMPFSFLTTAGGSDTYRLSLSLGELCAPNDHGLFYYELLFLRGADTLFTDTAEDNVTFTLAAHSRGRFRLVVSQNEFTTPCWFHGKTMYHIFVDRFAPRGGTRVAGAVYHGDWQEEIEQFGAYPGAPVANNEFFGGTLWGVIDKLDYLAGLGVGVLYLSPIFRSVSNHKYDTGDYETVDPQFGGREALEALIAAARAHGMGVILDGVFNHTGDNSRYFDRKGAYGGNGAFSGRSSPYYDWFYFKEYPDKYECWWDIPILPKLNLSNPACHGYFVGEGGIIDTYTKMGIRGWRLDVADELPDYVLAMIREHVKKEAPDAPIIGEVWEDAVIKESYGHRRNYALGQALDSVMNYPLRVAALDFIHGRQNAYDLRNFLISQQMNYPKPMYYSLMNLLGSHDIERLRNALATSVNLRSLPREEQVNFHFSEESMDRALEYERLCAVLQFSIPGVPSVYYGDEQGMTGVNDPFNRGVFREDEKPLHDFYAKLAETRNSAPALSTGHAEFMTECRDVLMILRYITDGKDAFGLEAENGVYLSVINRGDKAYDYTADCSAAGLGQYKGSIPALSAEIVKLA